jgi:hypothetical protein
MMTNGDERLQAQKEIADDWIESHRMQFRLRTAKEQ